MCPTVRNELLEEIKVRDIGVRTTCGRLRWGPGALRRWLLPPCSRSDRDLAGRAPALPGHLGESMVLHVSTRNCVILSLLNPTLRGFDHSSSPSPPTRPMRTVSLPDDRPRKPRNSAAFVDGCAPWTGAGSSKSLSDARLSAAVHLAHSVPTALLANGSAG